ncbi:hypothetical protein BJ508DRAFT_326491 [Ascobolus immersus RN42]|uniref:Uncharacterized protein n=1 Tax=Ascobolus immersus RN42 TaxID=1160509 RepID=A0A3N4I7C0_ASCIM|nr:hypothetical protein BJ508DRAFT_326491 [Ascobolus immersus RN42]
MSVFSSISLLATTTITAASTGTPLLLLPQHSHSVILDSLAQEGPLRWEPSVPLAGLKDILESYWGIKATPIAGYTLEDSWLVLCKEGVWQMEDTQEYCRFRGALDKPEKGEWQYFSLYIDGPESDPEC